MGNRKASPKRSDARREVLETQMRVYLKKPDCVRLERSRVKGGRVEECLTVTNDKQWWERDNLGHVEMGERSERCRPTLSDIECHFDGNQLRQFFVHISLEPIGSVHVAGRACVQLRGVLRAGGSIWPHWLPYNADEYEFAADAELGVLLSIVGKQRGVPFDVSEVLDIEYDSSLDESLFMYEPRLGEQLRSAQPITEILTLEAAVAKMPFQVLIPTQLPDADHTELQIMYHTPRIGGGEASLTISFRNDEYRLWMYERGREESDLDEYEWDQLEHAGVPISVSDPGVEKGLKIAALQQHGTHVTIYSDLELDKLLETAASLAPAKI
jgi:hypothetical protein